MLKKDIRIDYLKKRMAQEEKVWVDNSARMREHFLSLKFSPVRYILSYSPLNDRNEFDVSNCVDILKEKSPHIIIAWPRMDPDMKSMEAFQVEHDGLYAKNKYNILEPLNGAFIPPKLFDVAIIPLLAFDKKGFRVGYGKGFYDRYLAQCRPDLLKIGFSFFDEKVEIDDINEFDVPLNLCITPSRIYEF
ncbi:MAG: 5-formyltetrahydrofolate cyclo-ligase [Chitinophagaceae bacterium]